MPFLGLGERKRCLNCISELKSCKSVIVLSMFFSGYACCENRLLKNHHLIRTGSDLSHWISSAGPVNPIEVQNLFPIPPGIEPYEEYQGDTKPSGEPSSGTPPYFDAHLLAEKNITSIDQYLDHLPEVYKRRVMALKGTGSLHKVSPQFPRIVMHNYDYSGRKIDNNAMTLIAISTDPSDPKKDVVEGIHWNPKKYEFEFFAIDFSTGRPVALPTEECKECHSEHLRPNWDPFNNWPNAIGSKERFNPQEIAHLQQVVQSNERMARHFKLENLISHGEQTPGTVMFYGLFGPTQKFVANKMVTHPNYEKNKRSLVKALAGCKEEIDKLKSEHAELFENYRKEIITSAPKFKFEGYNPVLQPEFMDQFSAILSLFKTEKDDVSWFGKTTKMKQMYSHAFYQQDFEMLIGAVCERDTEIGKYLVQHGADASDPCHKRGNLPTRLCQVQAPSPSFTAPSVEPYPPISLGAVGE